jgi:hypothetical protein
MFSCILCNYSNQYKKNFMQHCETKIHTAKEEFKLYCCICNKYYISIQTYKKHKLIVHCNKAKSVKNKKQNTNHNDNKNVNTKLDEVKEEIKEEIHKSNDKVVTVVNKAITKATSLIKYLMQHHQNVPPIKKITDEESIKLLRIDYECPSKKPNDFILEQRLIYDHFKGNFVKNISKSILNIIDHKKPKNQPIYNTDSSRYNYVIKTTDEAWDEDKAGIKFSEYIVKPFLLSIGDLIKEYREKKLECVNMRKNTLIENEEHIDLLSKTLNLETDIINDRLITPILKELTPFLRYLQSEIEELEKYNEMEKIQKELEEIIKNDSDDDLDEPIHIVEYIPQKKKNNIVIEEDCFDFNDNFNDNYINRINKRLI